MKTTLTSADPSGWYLCYCPTRDAQSIGKWDGCYLSNVLERRVTLSNYTNFRRLFSEDDAAALREELTALRDEVKRLKSQPYEMRRADKPDCEGLWRNAHGDICKVKSDKDIDSFGEAPPYHYLGPVPVVIEQKPPRVVRVRYMDNEYDAIRVRHFGFVLLGHDGNGERYVTKEESEEVQS